MTLSSRAAALWATVPAGARDALAAFAAWRLPLLVVLVGAAHELPLGDGAKGMGLAETPLHALLRWDSGWYLRIVTQGYWYVPGRQSDVAFFPAYPLLAKALTFVGVSPPMALLLVANAALLVALWGLRELAVDRFGADAAPRTLAAFLVFPTAIYTSAGYSESTLAAAAAWALVFFERRRLVPLALCVAAACVSRPQGVIIAAAIGVGCLARRDWRLFSAVAAASALAVGAWCGFQAARFGDPLAFLHARVAWGVSTAGSLKGIASYVWEVARYKAWSPFESLLDLLSAALMLGLAGTAWRALGPAHALILAGITLVTLANGQLAGMARFALGALPLFVLLGRRPLPRAVVVGSLAACVLLGFRYVNGYWVD